MKIEVFDSMIAETDVLALRKEAQRVQLIIEGLGSLPFAQTAYYTYGKDTFPAHVLEVIDQKGLDVLPLTYLDDHLVKETLYPTNEEFMAYSGVQFTIDEDDHHGHDHGGCCGGSCCGHAH